MRTGESGAGRSGHRSLAQLPPARQPIVGHPRAQPPRAHRQLLRRSIGVALLVGLVWLVGAGLTAFGAQAAAEHYYDGGDPAELALAHAVAAGDAPRIARLVSAGADPDAVGTDYITMAQWAIEAHSPDGLRALLAAGALRDRLGRAGRAPLHDAARLDDPRYVKILLDAGADPDVRTARPRTTPLREACLASAPATLQALEAGGANLDAADVAGDRALHVCARADAGDLVLSLLQHGANPTLRNNSGNTFQDYYFSFDRSLLSRTSRHERHKVVVWLDEHHIAAVPEAAEYR